MKKKWNLFPRTPFHNNNIIYLQWLIILSVLNRFQQQTTTRITRLIDLNSKFGFLRNEDLDILHQNCLDFGNFYATDVDGEELCTEIYDCKTLLVANRDTSPLSPLDLLHFIVSYYNDVFQIFHQIFSLRHC